MVFDVETSWENFSACIEFFSMSRCLCEAWWSLAYVADHSPNHWWCPNWCITRAPGGLTSWNCSITCCHTFKYCAMVYSGHSETKWPLLYLFFNNYDLFCEKYLQRLCSNLCYETIYPWSLKLIWACIAYYNATIITYFAISLQWTLANLLMWCWSVD